MIRLPEFKGLLDAALSILGSGAGRVELVDGGRRVRVGRLTGPPGDVSMGGVPAGEEIRVIRAPEGVMVRSPAVGVISFRDNRTDRPLVEVGQAIARGQTLAFISALEITTKVTAPVSGIVEEVLVEDGDGVEYNAPLLKLLPTA